MLPIKGDRPIFTEKVWQKPIKGMAPGGGTGGIDGTGI